MHRIKASVCWLGAFALTGCNLAPKYTPPTVAAPASYTGMGPWTPSAPADATPRGAWWGIYDDQTLNRLEQQLDTQNPSLSIALSRYDEARQDEAEARAAEYPELDLAGSITQNKQSAERPLREGAGPDQYAADTLEGSFSYELDLWGKIRNQVAAGKDEAEASADDAADLRLSLEAQLADAYFNLRGLDAQEQLLIQTSADYLRALQLTQAQHEGGIASGLDVGRAQTQYDTAKAAETDVIAARAAYQDEIAVLIGVPAPSFTLAAAPALPPPPEIPVSAPSTLLQRRPDIAAAERRVAEANAKIGVARAAYFPSISLGASGGYQDAGGGINLFNAPNTLWSVGPSLAMTLFDGGLRHAATKAAIDQFDQAGDGYRSTVLTAFQQVEDNLWLCNGLADEAAQEQDAVQAADNTANLAMTLYQEGATTYLDVVTAQTAGLDAKRQSLSIATRRLQASVNLVRALGGGWSPAG